MDEKFGVPKNSNICPITQLILLKKPHTQLESNTIIYSKLNLYFDKTCIFPPCPVIIWTQVLNLIFINIKCHFINFILLLQTMDIL